jgi:hypothetical protein
VGGDIFRALPDRLWAPLSHLKNGYLVSFPGVKRPGVALTTHPHLASMSKKEQSYDSSPISALVVCSRVTFYSYMDGRKYFFLSSLLAIQSVPKQKDGMALNPSVSIFFVLI